MRTISGVLFYASNFIFRCVILCEVACYLRLFDLRPEPANLNVC
jgi:hypothetical protein